MYIFVIIYFVMRILIINGPNLHNIGSREPNIYGKQSFNSFIKTIREEFKNSFTIETYQSNSEYEIVDMIHLAHKENYGGIVLNPGAYTHNSVAIRDAIMCGSVPVVCVHISNVYSRELFRKKNIIAGACKGVITGFGLESYRLALFSL